MEKKSMILIGIALLIITTIPVFAENSGLAEQINDIMKNCAENDNYHITAGQLSNWMKAGKDDFMVVDIRFAPDDGPWGQPKYGRIPESVFIPNYDLFTTENLAKLQKNKKIILVGHMGIHENYSVVPLRLLGYDAYVLLMGMSGWQKDYPAAGHLKMLINAPNVMDFPLIKEAEGHMMHNKHKGHKQ
jgi:rhodanese-related sulfurtransferase